MSISIRQARAIIRKARRRVPEGENITALNLVAMMDMMTMLLVFLVMNATVVASPLNVHVALPPSTTQLPEPEASKTVTIAKTGILVEGEPVVDLIDGNIDPSVRPQGQFGIEIGPLRQRLSEHHQGLYNAAKMMGTEPRHELTIIADKDTRYQVLYDVMYTAGLSSAKDVPNGPGFLNYRLIVLREQQ